METKLAATPNTVNPNAPPVDAEADVIISDDEQTAYLGIRPPSHGGRDLTREQILAALEKRRVVFGVNTEAVAGLAEHPQYGAMTVVAQGEQPVQGADARLDFHFSLNREIKPRERSDGTVDYHDLGLIEAVTEGQKLCTLTPAVKGTPGRTVTGRVILPANVRSFGLPVGKNTIVSDDKTELFAASGGSVEYQNGKVQVNTVFTVKGDVCNSTGNIDFDGTVIVNGDVLAGFTVKATGGISVLGNVEGASLAAGGDIKISAGLVGQGRGRAVCGGNFKAFFVENAEVMARGDVTADVFMHSIVRCGGTLTADGKKGAIIGGTYTVGRDVKALTVGTTSGVVTTLELGIDPTVVDRVRQNKERTRVLTLELTKLGQILQTLIPFKVAGKLSGDRLEMLEKAIITKENHEREIAALTAEHDELATMSAGFAASSLVCKRELYYGTKISICQIAYTVPSDLIRCKICLSAGREISVLSV